MIQSLQCSLSDRFWGLELSVSGSVAETVLRNAFVGAPNRSLGFSGARLTRSQAQAQAQTLVLVDSARPAEPKPPNNGQRFITTVSVR